MSGMDRRSFFKIVATTGAAAAAGGCGQSAEQFIPYVVPPDNIVPGVAGLLRDASVASARPAAASSPRTATAASSSSRAIPTTRPIPAPSARSGTRALQALYHPDRFRGALSGGKPVAWAEAEKQLADKLGALAKGKQGARVAVVSGLETGSLARLMDEWVRLLGARARIAYEPLGFEALRASNRVAFGRDAIPDYAIGEATYLVSFGADFLETWLNSEGYTADFARMHAFFQGKQGTFVHVEPRMSLTAANADEWLRNAPGTEGALALAMLKVIVDEGLQASGADLTTLRAAVRAADVEAAATASGVPAAAIKKVARDLAKAKAGLVLGGGMASTSTGSTEALVAVNLLNAAIGAVGTRVRFGAASPFSRVSPYSDMVALTQAMAAGQIEVLVLADVNPVYAMPPKSGFAEALAKVPLVVCAREPAQRDDRAGAPGPADAARARGLGRLRLRGRRARAHAADDGTRADRWQGDRRQGHRRRLPQRRPPGLGARGRQGPAQVGHLRGLRARGVAEDREGPRKPRRVHRVLGSRPPARRRVAHRSRSGGLAAPGGRTDPGGRRRSSRAAGTHALIVYPSSRFYDGRGRRPAVAARGAGRDDPGGVGLVGRDSRRDRASRWASRAGDLVKRDVPARRHRAARLPDRAHARRRGGGGDGAGARVPGAFAQQGNAATGTQSQANYLNVGANPIELLPAAPDPSSGGLPLLAVKVSLAKTGGRRPLAIPQAQFDQDDREIAQWVGAGRRARARAARQAGRARETIRACTRR